MSVFINNKYEILLHNSNDIKINIMMYTTLFTDAHLLMLITCAVKLTFMVSFGKVENVTFLGD